MSAAIARVALLAGLALAASGAQAQFNLRNLDINKVLDTAKNVVKATSEIGAPLVATAVRRFSGRLPIASRLALVAMRYSQARNSPRAVSLARQARRNASCTASSASSNDPSIR